MNIHTIRILIRSLFCALIIGAFPAVSSAAVAIGVSVDVAPPPLPVYVQPPCPAPGYLWTPGYWAYGPDGYYWVPGAWVLPPRVDVLWTPGYWAYRSGYYVWSPGYWAPHVGFYGGVRYGFGYFGSGFVGGFWAGRVFRYNTAVVNVNRTVIHDTYIDRTVIRHTTVINRASFNGPGGWRATPTARERRWRHEIRYRRTPEQLAHDHAAARNPAQRFADNHGHPHIATVRHINARRHGQQHRIANGVASGQLTPGETRHLEKREQHLNRTIHAQRHANGGKLTPHQRRQINRRQNHLNRSIRRDKHNGAIQHDGHNRIGQRRKHQQQRLARGIANGQIGAGGAARSERHEQRINHRLHARRVADNGHLTRHQRRRINRQQNRVSRRIHRQQHPDRRAMR